MVDLHLKLFPVQTVFISHGYAHRLSTRVSVNPDHTDQLHAKESHGMTSPNKVNQSENDY